MEKAKCTDTGPQAQGHIAESTGTASGTAAASAVGARIVAGVGMSEERSFAHKVARELNRLARQSPPQSPPNEGPQVARIKEVLPKILQMGERASDLPLKVLQTRAESEFRERCWRLPGLDSFARATGRRKKK